MRNLIIGLLVVAALVVGGGIIAQTAYQAGVSTAVTTAAANAPAGTVVTPVAPYPYPYYGPGWGWHGGFGIFGFFFFLFFLFLIFGLLRAVFWRGRGGWGGPGGPGRWGGPGGPGAYGGPGKWGDHDHRAASRRPSTTCIGSRTKGPQPRARQVRRRNRTGRPDRSRGHAPSRTRREGASVSLRCLPS